MPKPGDPRAALPTLLAKSAPQAEAALAALLRTESRLPGPRGNLELAAAFVHELGARIAAHPKSVWGWWSLCLEWTRLSLAEAPVNDPGEFLVFCGTAALPVFADGVGSAKVWAEGKRLAADPRWRTREAVAMAIQAMAARDAKTTLLELRGWARAKDEWLLLRAVAAGVAEPSLLAAPSFARAALALHKTLLARLAAAKERRSPEFASFRQGLGYSLSVVVAALPEAGWPVIEALIRSGDKDVRWVLTENLKKKRLSAADPKRVSRLLGSLKGRARGKG